MNSSLDLINNKESPNTINLELHPNDTNLDSYSYLGEDNVESISCNGKQAVIKFKNKSPKSYDIDIPSIMKKKVIGDIEEIDKIHNSTIKHTTFFGDMKFQHLGNTMKNLHYHTNEKILQAHQSSFQREKFFQDN